MRTPRPLLHRAGLAALLALSLPFVAFNGRTDRVCTRQEVGIYMRKLQKGRLVLLPHLGHSFAVRERWAEPFRKAYDGLFR